MITGQDISKLPKNKRPGPKRSPCPHCGQTECSHCRCTGTPYCCHQGKMCTNHRYRRRLVCNPCEKNRIKYQTSYGLPVQTPEETDIDADESSYLCGSMPESLMQSGSFDNESQYSDNFTHMSSSYTQNNEYISEASRRSSADFSMDNTIFSPSSTKAGNDDIYQSYSSSFRNTLPSIMEDTSECPSKFSVSQSLQDMNNNIHNILQNSMPLNNSERVLSNIQPSNYEENVIRLPSMKESTTNSSYGNYKHKHAVYICTAQSMTPFGYILIDPNHDNLRYVRKFIENNYADEIERNKFVFVNLQGHIIIDDKESRTLCWKETELRHSPCLDSSTNTYYREFRCISILLVPNHISEQIQSNVARMLSPSINTSKSVPSEVNTVPNPSESMNPTMMYNENMNILNRHDNTTTTTTTTNNNNNNNNANTNSNSNYNDNTLFYSNIQSSNSSLNQYMGTNTSSSPEDMSLNTSYNTNNTNNYINNYSNNNNNYSNNNSNNNNYPLCVETIDNYMSSHNMCMPSSKVLPDETPLYENSNCISLPTTQSCLFTDDYSVQASSSMMSSYMTSSGDTSNSIEENPTSNSPLNPMSFVESSYLFSPDHMMTIDMNSNKDEYTNTNSSLLNTTNNSPLPQLYSDSIPQSVLSPSINKLTPRNQLFEIPTVFDSVSNNSYNNLSALHSYPDDSSFSMCQNSNSYNNINTMNMNYDKSNYPTTSLSSVQSTNVDNDMSNNRKQLNKPFVSSCTSIYNSYSKPKPTHHKTRHPSHMFSV